MNPLITVILPAFNRRDTIMRAIESVFRQTYRPLEVILVDDCSTDGTSDLVSSVRFPEPIRVIKLLRNEGPAGARNAGIREASGQYVAFLDSDDWWLPTKIEKQVQVISTASPLGRTVVYTQAHIIRRFEKIIRPVRRQQSESLAEYIFCNGGFIAQDSVMMPVQLVKSTAYDPNLRNNEDWDLFFRLEQQGVRFVLIEEPLTVVVDLPVPGRASAPQNPERLLALLARHKGRISERAYSALRAKTAPLLRSTAPIEAAGAILSAYSKDAIGPFMALSLIGRLVCPELREVAYRVRGFVAGATWARYDRKWRRTPLPGNWDHPKGSA